MRFEGRIWKDGRHWLAEVPLLDVMTQGRTRADALEMIVDALAALSGRRELQLTVFPTSGRLFEIGGSDLAALVALLLRRRRQAHGLSLAQVSRRLGQRSRNAYARYEQGKSVPTVEKLDELLRAIDPGRDFVLRESRA